jgi:23S rRNA U2552 (ribose-2'-O)-methylase RlmE/FtsJ
MLIQNKSDKFTIKIKQGKFNISNELFHEISNEVIELFNKYFKPRIANGAIPYEQNVKNIILYKFLLTQDLSYYIYALKKYNLKTKNLLICSPNLNISEVIEFINEHYENHTINYNTILFKEFTRISNEIFNNNLSKYNNRFSKNNSSNIIVLDNISNLSLMLPPCKKYNFLILDNFNPNNELYTYDYFSTKSVIYGSLLIIESLLIHIKIILKNLSDNGECIITSRIPYIYNKSYIDLIYFISTYFKSFNFEKLILNNHYTYLIVCKGFKGSSPKDIELITSVYDKFKNIYPENINKSSLNDLLKNTVISIFDVKNTKQYKSFVKSVSEFYNLLIQEINNTIDEATYLQNEIELGNKTLEEYYSNKYLADTINLGRLLDIELLPRLQEKVFHDNFGKSILRNMFSYDNYIWYKFKKHNYPKFHININLDIDLESFVNIPHQFNLATILIDTRNVNDYNNIKKQVRYYEKTLTKYIETNFVHNRKISRAFLKSYEIIETCGLISPTLKTFNSFSICEAPGAFILAVNHYVKTKTDIETFTWTAQTLNPKTKFQGKCGLGDDFKLMRKYPKQWDFGPKKTGDVTDLNNIRYYRETYKDKNLHLVTGDCGLALFGNLDPDLLGDKLHVAQIIIMLSILKRGGNFVLKMYLPSSEPIYLSLFYLLYTRFKSFEIYKTFQNSWSAEFYIIGKSYIDPISDIEFNNLLGLFKNFSLKKSIIPMNKIPQPFLLQIEYILQQLLTSFKMAIRRVIYYVDNDKDITKEHRELLIKSMHTKNVDWNKIFKIRKIKKTDIIH